MPKWFSETATFFFFYLFRDDNTNVRYRQFVIRIFELRGKQAAYVSEHIMQFNKNVTIRFKEQNPLKNNTSDKNVSVNHFTYFFHQNILTINVKALSFNRENNKYI